MRFLIEGLNVILGLRIMIKRTKGGCTVSLGYPYTLTKHVLERVIA